MDSKGKKILIADDEEIIRKICDITLTKSGYRVLTAKNGVDALNILSKYEYDIALIDLKMPLMGGLELLHNLRRDFPHIHVIIMTAYATIENAINAMKEGAYDFILKPFKADQLRVVVDRCAKSIDLNKEVQELKLAYKKLKEVQDMKDKFIAITSHELRTPVSHIKGYLTILSDDAYKNITEQEQYEFMNIIKSAVTDLENVVHNMFEITKIENGQLTLNIDKFLLNDLIGQVVHEFQYVQKKRNIELITSDLEVPLAIEGDRQKLKQVISELLQNAIKFTPDGGKIEINAKTEDDLFILKIIDSGIGIGDSEKSKIFEKFYEIQNSDYHSSSKVNFMGGGIGLGLTIAKAIVEAHHGRIIVNSIPKRGSEFTVISPLIYNKNTRMNEKY